MNTHFFVSTFHATRLVVSNWKIPSLCTFFDSLTKEKDKLIHMGDLRSSKGKYHALIVQGSKNTPLREANCEREEAKVK